MNNISLNLINKYIAYGMAKIQWRDLKITHMGCS